MFASYCTTKQTLTNTLVQFGLVDHQTPKSKLNGLRVNFSYITDIEKFHRYQNSASTLLEKAFVETSLKIIYRDASFFKGHFNLKPPFKWFLKRGAHRNTFVWVTDIFSHLYEWPNF